MHFYEKAFPLSEKKKKKGNSEREREGERTVVIHEVGSGTICCDSKTEPYGQCWRLSTILTDHETQGGERESRFLTFP